MLLLHASSKRSKKVAYLSIGNIVLQCMQLYRKMNFHEGIELYSHVFLRAMSKVRSKSLSSPPFSRYAHMLTHAPPSAPQDV